MDKLNTNGTTAVAMFHIGRCGSTVLADMLGRQPNFRSLGEIYTAYRDNRNNERAATPLEYTVAKLTRGFESLRQPGTLMVEVKFLTSLDMTCFPLGLADFVNVFHGMGFSKAIVLSRRNLLRRMVSTAIALKRTAYQLRIGETVDVPSVELPLVGAYLGTRGSLVQIFAMIEAEYASLRQVCASFGIEMLDLEYEQDIQSNPAEAVAKVCGFLGRPMQDVPPKFLRINNKSLVNVLTNYAEVAAALSGTKYEWMLEAD